MPDPRVDPLNESIATGLDSLIVSLAAKVLTESRQSSGGVCERAITDPRNGCCGYHKGMVDGLEGLINEVEVACA